MELLEHEETSPLRHQTGMLPVDLDSRIELLRVIHPENQPRPILSDVNKALLLQVLRERESIEKLKDAGLHPTRTILFTGPPGLGKTMSARWLASQLGLPLMVLDLSTVMSSLLGKTGGNLRAVIDFAKSEHGILLLDEFDAVAKRRDDAVDIGELKRLVTVLLQEIDLWPHDRLLIAATNHEDLLDPAIWRRFDVHLRFEKPDKDQLKEAAEELLSFRDDRSELSGIVAGAFTGRSFSDLVREITRIRKQALLTGVDFVEALKGSTFVVCKSLKPRARTKIAVEMIQNGATKSAAHEWTGAARPTIDRALAALANKNGNEDD